MRNMKETGVIKIHEGIIVEAFVYDLFWLKVITPSTTLVQLKFALRPTPDQSRSVGSLPSAAVE